MLMSDDDIRKAVQERFSVSSSKKSSNNLPIDDAAGDCANDLDIVDEDKEFTIEFPQLSSALDERIKRDEDNTKSIDEAREGVNNIMQKDRMKDIFDSLI
jgi:hypothetical protein